MTIVNSRILLAFIRNHVIIGEVNYKNNFMEVLYMRRAVILA